MKKLDRKLALLPTLMTVVIRLMGLWFTHKAIKLSEGLLVYGPPIVDMDPHMIDLPCKADLPP